MAFFADDYSLPHLQQEALAKAAKKGEGSRGGHIIGHTKSGKPIYSIGHKNYQHKESHSDYYGEINPLDSGLSAGHAGTLVQRRFADYSKNDHLDAANAHNKAASQWRGKHRETLENADRAVHGKLKNSIYHFEDGNRSAGTRTDYSASDNKALESAHAAMSGHEAAAVAHLDAASDHSMRKSQHGEGSRGGEITGHTKSGKPIYGHRVGVSRTLVDRGGAISGKTSSGKHIHDMNSPHYRSTRNPIETMSTSSPIGPTRNKARNAVIAAHPHWNAQDHRDAAAHHKGLIESAWLEENKNRAKTVALAHEIAADKIDRLNAEEKAGR